MTENPRCFQARAKVCGFIRPSVILSDVDDSHGSVLANTVALSPLSLTPEGYLQPSLLQRGRSHLLRLIRIFPGSIKTLYGH